MEYSQSTDTITSYNVQTAQPLDIKGFFKDEADMQDVTTGNDPLSYYQEMLARDMETGIVYRWIESVLGVISGGYTYPTVYAHDGVDYGGKTFNFVAIGNPILAFQVADTWEPLENYPQGTIALRQFVDGADTITGVYRKTDNVAPGTWVELFRYSYELSDAYIEALVVAMLAGTGALDTLARSDHDHDTVYMDIDEPGFLYEGLLDNTKDLDNLNPEISGLYIIQDGSVGNTPGGFPSNAEIGYAPSSSDGFWIKYLKEFSNLTTSKSRYMELGDVHGPICHRYLDSSGAPVWSSWERVEATDADMLLGTVINKQVTPSSLKKHGAWVSISLPSNGWTGTAEYRVLNNGQIHMKGKVNGSSISDYMFYITIADNAPSYNVSAPCIFENATDTLGGIFTINTGTTAVSVSAEISGSTVTNGDFTFDIIYDTF